MATFYIYADESGKLKQSDYTSFFGYIGHASEWARFGMEWDNARMRWQVPAIHMRAIRFPERDKEWSEVKARWGRDWEARRDLMLNDFVQTIRSAQIVALGAVVDAKHFRSLPDSDFKKESRDPLYLAFHTVVMRGIETTEVVDKHSPISIVVDDDQDYSIGCYKLLDVLRTHPDLMFSKVKERIHGMCFGNDKSYPGIQAADMLAYESRRLMVEKIRDPNFPASEMYLALTLFLQHQPHFYTPAILDQLADKTNEVIKKNNEENTQLSGI